MPGSRSAPARPALSSVEGPALSNVEGTSHAQPSRRGGRRYGAGAPRANTNALKTGRYSQRVRALEHILEDLSRYAPLIWSVAGPRREEMRRLVFVLQCDAQALLNELRGAVLSQTPLGDSLSKGVTGPPGSIKRPVQIHSPAIKPPAGFGGRPLRRAFLPNGLVDQTSITKTPLPRATG